MAPELRNRLIEIMKSVVHRDARVIFAYIYGSFPRGEDFRDIDLAIYVKNPEENPFVTTSDLMIEMSDEAKKENLEFIPDRFDVNVINDAPFTFLRRVFTEGILVLDRDPDLRTDVIEFVSSKYRECAGLLAEALL